MVEKLEKIQSYGDTEIIIGSTLLMAGPGSLGHLGALSIDLVINNLDSLDKVATLNSPYIEQIVGSGIYSNNDLTLTSCLEVWYSKKLELTVVQLRSFPITGYGVAFSKSIAEWIRKCQFKNVVILSGLDKTQRNDQQLNRSLLWYYSNGKSCQEYVNQLKKKNVPHLEIENQHNLFPTKLAPGSGSTQFLVNSLEENKVDLLVLSYFTEQGDNLIASKELASAALDICELKPASLPLVIPASWEVLYGSKVDSSLY